MAQFLQKLAGFSDEQIAARYKNANTKLTDIGQFKTSNPARYYAILWLADTGITVGCNASGTKFCPNALVNRGAMAQFMQKFAGVAVTPTNQSGFVDVSPQLVNLKYDGTNRNVRVPGLDPLRIGAINWMKNFGITVGSGSASSRPTFKPQDPVNRGAMAQFMHKLAFQLGATTVKPN
jgi:5'-nucleotidase